MRETSGTAAKMFLAPTGSFQKAEPWRGRSSPPMPCLPEKQIVNFFSFMDNYNGLSNLAQGAHSQPSGMMFPTTSSR